MWILPMVNVKIKLVDRVQQDDAQTLFAPLLISLLSPLTSAFSSTYLYQKDKRALLGNLYSRTFISSPVKCSLSHYRPPLPLFHSRSHCSLFKVLKQIFASAAGNLLITFRNLALLFSVAQCCSVLLGVAQLSTEFFVTVEAFTVIDYNEVFTGCKGSVRNVVQYGHSHTVDRLRRHGDQ
jgi:hypothetical protein